MADSVATRAAHVPRQTQLLRLGEAVRGAAAGADWALLGAHVNALAPQLRALAAHGPWNAAEREALAGLRAAHDAAFAATAGAARELEAKLEQLRSQKDGCIAYAMHSDTESGKNEV
jgi:hypothetical protein